MLERQKEFSRRHIVLTSLNHFAGGFGSALIIQYFIVGDPFLPVAVGGALLAFFAIVHVYEWSR